jgi:C-terminal processing protease CtpA/Prc
MRAAVAEEDSNPLKADPRMKRLPAGATTQFAYFVEPDPRLKTPILDAKIYVLTSKATASAGEAATFALKQSRRAQIVGEVTQGAGHLGPTIPIGGGYRAFIPVARIFDADTGIGWEGKGIVPDVQVPAAQALDVAAARAGIDGMVANEAWRRLPSQQPPR